MSQPRLLEPRNPAAGLGAAASALALFDSPAAAAARTAALVYHASQLAYTGRTSLRTVGWRDPALSC